MVNLFDVNLLEKQINLSVRGEAEAVFWFLSHTNDYQARFLNNFLFWIVRSSLACLLASLLGKVSVGKINFNFLPSF